MIYARALPALALAGAMAAQAHAATWDGQGRSNDWTDPDNWAGNVLPPPRDSVIIPPGFTVNLNTTANLSSIDCQGTLLVPSGGNLILASPSNITSLALTGGLISGPGSLTITSECEHTAGDFAPGGDLIITPGATYLSSSASPKSSFRNIDNHGVATINSTLNLAAPTRPDSVTLNNAAEGQCNLAAGLTRTGSGSGAIVNEGTLLVPASAIATLSPGVEFFHNAGAFTIDAGALCTINGIGVVIAPITINNGATLAFNADDPGIETLDGASFSGPGTLEITGRLTADDPLNVFCPTTLTGSINGPADITFFNNFTWNNGKMIGDGVTVLAGPATFEKLGVLDLALHRPLSIFAQTSWTAGNIALKDDAEGLGAIILVEGAVLYANAPNDTISADPSGNNQLSAAGLIVRDTPGEASFGTNLMVTATGEIEVEAGTLRILSGSAFLGGVLGAHEGAQLIMQHPQGGNVVFEETVFTGQGSIQLLGHFTAADHVTIDTASVLLDGTLDGPGLVELGVGNEMLVEAPGANLQGPGLLKVADATTIRFTADTTLARNTINEGTVEHTSQNLSIPSGITFTNEGLFLATGGSLAGSGTFQNNATFNRTEGGAFNIGANVILNNSPDSILSCDAGVLTVSTRFGASQGLITPTDGEVRFQGGDGSSAHVLDGATIFGDGLFSVAGGRLTLAGEVVCDCPASHSAGEISGNNSNLIIGRDWNWSNGSLLGGNSGGNITLQAGATMFICCTNGKTLSRHFDAAGTIVWDSGQIQTFSGAVVNILPSGLLSIEGGTDFAGSGDIFNHGSIIKSTPNNATLGSTGSIVHNTGNIAVLDGELKITAETFLNYEAGALVGGQYTVADNSTLRYDEPGIDTLDRASVTLQGPGAQVLELTGADAFLDLASITQPTQYALKAGANAQTNTALDLDGAFTIDPPSFYKIVGDLNAGPAAQLALTITLPLEEGAPLAPIDAEGAANLDGTLTLDIEGEGDLAPGTTLPLLTAANIAGAFNALNAPTADGATWQIVQTPTTLALQLVPTCQGDLTGDNAVNSQDLNALLAAFGTTPAGDLDGDNDTDSQDLNILLAAFGDVCL